MKNIIIFLATLFALFAPAQAVTIESYKIISEITDKDTVTENIIITLVNDMENNINSATITLPKESTITSVHDTYGSLFCNISKTNRLAVNLKFTKPLAPCNNLRGLKKVNIEAGLYYISHNVRKIYKIMTETARKQIIHSSKQTFVAKGVNILC